MFQDIVTAFSHKSTDPSVSCSMWLWQCGYAERKHMAFRNPSWPAFLQCQSLVFWLLFLLCKQMHTTMSMTLMCWGCMTQECEAGRGSISTLIDQSTDRRISYYINYV